MKNENIFVTGGADFLGENLVNNLYKASEVTVYSKDNAKHY